MKNNALKTFLILLLAAVIPFIFIAATLAFLPKIYGETFLGEMAAKYELLKSTKEEKVIIIGGSSTAFGIDSEIIGGALGKKVINFGLYATLGTKMMLDLSRANVRRGDIIVLAPELDRQTLSMYFNAESAWQAIEGDYSMLLRIGKDNYSDLAGGIIPFLSKKFEYALQGRTVNQTGVYSRSSFSPSGDIVYPREYNVMTFGYDTNQEIELVPDIFDPEFIDYVNSYISWAERRGAKVYFSFCPMNASALAEGTTEESVYRFVEFIEDSIHCPVISNPWDSILDSGYFYDTNYHLNDAGVVVHSETLANDILRETGSTDALVLELPDPPGKKPAETNPGTVVEEDPDEKYFVFEEVSGLVAVTGVTDEGAAMKELRIPATHGGAPVSVLGNGQDGVFANCRSLERVVIGEGLSAIRDGAFSGCATLREILMDREDTESLEASTELFDGVSDSVKITFNTETALDNFSVGYWWAYHSGRMEMAKKD